MLPAVYAQFCFTAAHTGTDASGPDVCVRCLLQVHAVAQCMESDGWVLYTC